MLGAGVKASTGQLSPGIWMNKCHISERYPTGSTVQGWTQPALRSFLDHLDQVGVRSIDMWTSNMAKNDMDTVQSSLVPSCSASLLRTAY